MGERGNMMSRSATCLCLILSLIPVGLILFRFHEVIPLWDSAIYARCALEIGHQSPAFPLARCGLGDPTVSYLTPLWFFSTVTGAGIPGLYLGNLLLFLIYLYAIVAILRASILRNSTRFIDYLFPIALFACDPLSVTYTLIITPDFGTTAFITAYIAAMLSRHFLVAMFFGLMTLFAKATALSLFGLLGSATLLYVSFKEAPSFKVATRLLATRFFMVTLVPLLAYWSSMYLFKIFPTSFDSQHLKGTCWSRPNNIFDLLFTFDFTSPAATNYLFNVFLLNFHWIETLLLPLCIGLGAYRIIGRRACLRADATRAMSFLAVGLLFLSIAVYATTRCLHFNNPRYILVTVPFFHLAFLYAIYFAGLSGRIRNSILALVISLQVSSSLVTIDPVSKWFYGVIPFGDASLLAMTSRTGECCGLGRDQLFYNTQALYIDEITARIIKEIPASPESPFVVDNQAMFSLLGRETSNHVRCLSAYQKDCNNGTPLLGSNPFAPQRMPQSFTYIDYPFVPVPANRRDFAPQYELEGITRFRSGQHFIDTYRYVLRGPSSAQ